MSTVLILLLNLILFVKIQVHLREPEAYQMLANSILSPIPSFPVALKFIFINCSFDQASRSEI